MKARLNLSIVFIVIVNIMRWPCFIKWQGVKIDLLTILNYLSVAQFMPYVQNLFLLFLYCPSEGNTMRLYVHRNH